MSETKKKTTKKKSGKKGSRKKGMHGLGFLGVTNSKVNAVAQEVKRPVGYLLGLFASRTLEAGLSKVKFLNPEPDPTTGEVSKMKKLMKPGTVLVVAALGSYFTRKKKMGDFAISVADGMGIYAVGKTVSVLINKDLFGFDHDSPALFGLGASDQESDQMFLENKELVLKQIEANSFQPQLEDLTDSEVDSSMAGPGSDRIFGSNIQFENAAIY